MSLTRSPSRRGCRPTAKALLYVALILALITSAILMRDFRPIALTVPAALMVGFSSLFTQRASVKVSRVVERTRAMPGERVKVRLEVASDKPCLVELREPSTAPIVGGGSTFLLNLRGRASLEYEFLLPKRGFYQLGPTLAVFSDALGLFVEESVASDPSEVVALPKLMSTKGIKLAASYTGVWPGEVASRRSGRGYEFYGVREYAPGDELRRVNWRASARLGKLLVNEQVEERVTDVLLVVDAGLLGVLDPATVEEVVEAEVSLAASLALSLLRSGNRVGLVTRGRESSWVRPGFGRRHLDRVLYELTRLEAGEPAPLDYALNMLAPYLLKPNAELIVISPLLDSNIAISIFNLAPKYSVLVISPNPFRGDGGAAQRILEVERTSLIVKLSGVCRVVDWAPGALLLKASRRRALRGGW
ncbi:MAG: DUF58 domain-containing protein [Thermofilaceae archaeon]